jgi:hypothetical protein
MFGEIGEVFVAEIDVEVFGIELDAHQKQARLFVGMLVRVQNVAVVPVDEVSDGRNFALAVGARDQQDGGVLHGVTDDLRGERDVASNVSTKKPA